MKLTAHLHLVPRISMSVASANPLCLDGKFRDSFTFYAFVVNVKIEGKVHPTTGHEGPEEE